MTPFNGQINSSLKDQIEWSHRRYDYIKDKLALGAFEPHIVAYNKNLWHSYKEPKPKTKWVDAIGRKGARRN